MNAERSETSASPAFTPAGGVASSASPRVVVLGFSASRGEQRSRLWTTPCPSSPLTRGLRTFNADKLRSASGSETPQEAPQEAPQSQSSDAAGAQSGSSSGDEQDAPRSLQRSLSGSSVPVSIPGGQRRPYQLGKLGRLGNVEWAV